jgi:hypothetical protein
MAILGMSSQTLQAQEAAPAQQSCGTQTPVPAGPQGPFTGNQEPIYPDGEYPVKLPAKSLLGAPNYSPEPYPYDAGVMWGQFPRALGATASISTGPDNTIWVLDRCGHLSASGDACGGDSANINPVFQFDTSGKLLQTFGAGMMSGPHKLEVDKEGNVWVADNAVNQIFKFDPHGKLLMTVGEKGVAGTGDNQFDQPTDVAFGKDGTFFVADGHNGGGASYGNARIVKFDKNGKFLMTWGKKGTGPGEFDGPHALTVDNEGRLYVADRQNNRVQVFDQNGKFLKQWFQYSRPSGVYVDKHDLIYVGDSETSDGRSNDGHGHVGPFGYGFNPGAARGIRIGSVKDGKVKYFIPDICPYPYRTNAYSYEGVTSDAQGNVYGASWGVIRKYTLLKKN